MKRTATLTRTPLRPGRAPARRTPLRPSNAQRLAKLRALQFGRHADAVACLPCAVCRAEFYGRVENDSLATLLDIAGAGGGLPRLSDPHHASRTRGAGGRPEHVVPLCRAHLREVGTIGRITFARRHGVGLRALARRLARVSPLLTSTTTAN